MPIFYRLKEGTAHYSESSIKSKRYNGVLKLQPQELSHIKSQRLGNHENSVNRGSRTVSLSYLPTADNDKAARLMSRVSQICINVSIEHDAKIFGSK